MGKFIKVRIDNIVYYFGEEVYNNEILQMDIRTTKTFRITALANAVVDISENKIIKCRTTLESIFDGYYGVENE